MSKTQSWKKRTGIYQSRTIKKAKKVISKEEEENNIIKYLICGEVKKKNLSRSISWFFFGSPQQDIFCRVLEVNRLFHPEIRYPQKVDNTMGRECPIWKENNYESRVPAPFLVSTQNLIWNYSDTKLSFRDSKVKDCARTQCSSSVVI